MGSLVIQNAECGEPSAFEGWDPDFVGEKNNAVLLFAGGVTDQPQH